MTEPPTLEQVAPSLGHGRYQLVELLGAGGMALVYKANDTRLECQRAVKVLKPELDDLARERFFNEARTMAKLHHKNVVLVHDVADDGTNAYLVMELIEGGSVADRMAAYGPLPEKMACRVAIALLAGLGAAHQQGVVHRDVKPHNILVDSQGVPKVTDFGIAQASETSTTQTGAVIGTWAYMAPEQRTDAKSVDARADIFGAGCTLYNILTGIDPFDLYNQEVYEQLYKEVPESFRPLIQKATRYRADDRYPDAAAFQAALEELLPTLPDDPEDTPPLGISLEGRRADFVPTIMGRASGGSPATLAPRVSVTASTPGGIPVSWLSVVGLTMVAFICIGVGLGFLLLTSYFAVFSGEVALGTPESVEIEAPFSPDIPTIDGEGLQRVERSEASPISERSAPAPPTYIDEGPDEELPVDDASEFKVVVKARPRGTTIELNGVFRKNTWSGMVPAGQHHISYTHPKLPAIGFAVNVMSPQDICFDLKSRGPCE